MSLSLTLQLRPAEGKPAPPAAWLLPGPAAESWLHRIAAADWPQERLRLYVVPSRAGYAHPAGLLVAPPEGATIASPPPEALPYAARAERLLLPCDAQLTPAVRDEELHQLLEQAGPAELWLLHPAHGFIRFTESDRLRVADFIVPPPAARLGPAPAVEVIVLAPRLLQVEPEQLPWKAFLAEGGEGIGSRSLEDRDWEEDLADPFPEDSTGPGAGWDRLAKRLQSLAGKERKERGPQAWLARVAAWARKHAERRRGGGTDPRQGAMDRLLRLLQRNPDEGLRFAPPLQGPNAPRGFAHGGSGFVGRPVDFNSDALDYSGPVDVSFVPGDVYRELQRRYRELANRELQLGRARRAAYIFAHLLGDFLNAAAALRQGRYYREAAALYRERLNNPREAAECLLRGGLLPEAIPLLEELKEFERVGELHERLEQPEQARESFVRAADDYRERGRPREAARVFRERLGDFESAIALLREAWPNHPQSLECLDDLFALYAAEGRHAEAAEMLTRATTGNHVLAIRLALLDRLARWANEYPDRAINRQSAECCRGEVAAVLQAATADQADQALRALARLAPGDRLLERDRHRFVARRRAAEQAVRRRGSRLGPSGARGRAPECVARLPLLPEVDWTNALTLGDSLFAVGFTRDDRLVVQWLHWREASEETVVHYWPLHGATVRRIRLYAVGVNRLQLEAVGGGRLAPVTLSPSPAWHGFVGSVEIGHHSSPAEGALAAAWDGQHTYWHVRTEREQLVLNGYDYVQQLMSTHLLPLPAPEEDSPGSIPMTAWPGTVLLACGNSLLRFRQGSTEIVECEAEIRSLAVPEPFTRVRVALGHEYGGSLVTGESQLQPPQTFASELRNPHIALIRAGGLVAAGDRMLEIYHSFPILSLVAAQRIDHNPFALLTLPSIKHFALCAAGGIDILRVHL